MTERRKFRVTFGAAPKVRQLLGIALLLVGPTVQGTAASEPEVDPTTVPRPAEIMPRAASSIFLGVARAGDQYVAVGERGHVLRSRDGMTWQQVEAPVRRMLNHVQFDTATHGWAVGYDAAILQTSDGGNSWQVRHFDAEAQPLYDLHFISADVAVAVGGRGLVLRTTDGGATWEPLETDVFDLQFHLFSITGTQDGTLLITAEKGLLARSEDGGESWEMLAPVYTGSFFGALPHGASGAIVYGLRGHAYLLPDVSEVETEDPLTWDEFEAVTIEDHEELEDIGYRQLNTGTLQGLFGGVSLPSGGVVLFGVNGTILRSTPDLERFTAVAMNTPYTLNHAILENNRLLAVGRDGATWVPLR